MGPVDLAVKLAADLQISAGCATVCLGMRRTYRYPLHPTKAQAAVLESWLGYCCDLYNAALEHRVGAWKRARVSVSYNAQTAELTALRATDEAAAAMPTEVQRSALRRLDRAFAGFYRRCAAGSGPGFPRFRRKSWYGSLSFRFTNSGSRIEGNRVSVPKLGMVRFHLYRPLHGVPREVGIRRKNGRWWVCFSCDAGEAPDKALIVGAVGVDLGIAAFATFSDGYEVANPRYFRTGEALLARRQRALARKECGSRSRERALLLVAKAHEHVQNQRLDFSRKVVADLYRRHDLVVYEDLEIKDLASGTRAKSVHDAAWGVFLRCLACKAENAGKWAVAVNARGTSQKCSGCGAVVRKKLSERLHRCECGLRLGRDHNAAVNILAAGRAAVGLRPAEAPRMRCATASPSLEATS
jgi:putative transposase